MKSCAFTGHRQISAHHSAALPQLIDRAVCYAYGEGCRTFLSGGALGFDTLAARSVLRLKGECADVRLVLILPCRDQAAHWRAEDVLAYREMLDAADEIIYISGAYTDTCMKERNAALVDRADMLVAYVGRYASGAYQTVSIAKKKGIPVYNLYPRLEGK